MEAVADKHVDQVRQGMQPIADFVQSLDNDTARKLLLMIAYTYPVVWQSIPAFAAALSDTGPSPSESTTRPSAGTHEAPSAPLVYEGPVARAVERKVKRRGINGVLQQPDAIETCAPEPEKPSASIPATKVAGPQLNPSATSALSKVKHSMTTGGNHHFKSLPNRLRKKIQGDDTENTYMKFHKPLVYLKDNCMEGEPLKTRKEGMEALCEIGKIVCIGNGRESGTKVLCYFRAHPVLEHTLYEIALTLRCKSDVEFVNEASEKGTLIAELEALERMAKCLKVFDTLSRTVDHLKSFAPDNPVVEERRVMGKNPTAKKRSRVEVVDPDDDEDSADEPKGGCITVPMAFYP